MAFYWITDDKLITSFKQFEGGFESDFTDLIQIYDGLRIEHGRLQQNYAVLSGEHWSNIEQGADGYPIQSPYGYLIAGGEDNIGKFKA